MYIKCLASVSVRTRQTACNFSPTTGPAALSLAPQALQATRCTRSSPPKVSLGRQSTKKHRCCGCSQQCSRHSKPKKCHSGMQRQAGESSHAPPPLLDRTRRQSPPLDGCLQAGTRPIADIKEAHAPHRPCRASAVPGPARAWPLTTRWMPGQP